MVLGWPFTIWSERQIDLCFIGLMSVLRSLIGMPEFPTQGKLGNAVSQSEQTETGPSQKVNEWQGPGRNCGDCRGCSSVTKSSYPVLPTGLLPRVCPGLPHLLLSQKNLCFHIKSSGLSVSAPTLETLKNIEHFVKKHSQVDLQLPEYLSDTCFGFVFELDR